MSSSLQQRALLPTGFLDILPPDSQVRASIVSTVLDVFANYGYELVMPPTVEFEESLFTGSAKALENQTFRLMDPVSQKMMGLRPDITMQVGRIATTRLVNNPLPLRLSYSGQVFRVKGTGIHAERQTTQAGLELIGADSPEADAEVVQIAIDALNKLGVPGLSIDFSLPQLVTILLQTLSLTSEEKQALQQGLSKKDAAAIRALAGSAGDMLINMATPQGNGNNVIGHLLQLPLPEAALALCRRLEQVVTLVKKAIPGITVTIDPLEHRGFEYHTGIGFAIFSTHHTGELGSGGRYTILDKKEKAGQTAAVGVTLYINDIYRLVPPATAKPRIYLATPATVEDIHHLQQEGYITIQALSTTTEAAEEAKRLRCTAIYRSGKVEKL